MVGLAGKCADIQGGGTANGTRVWTFTCNGTVAQEWLWTAGELYNGHSGKCLEVAGGNMANRTPTQIYTCNQTLSQTWFPSSWAANTPTDLFVPHTNRRCFEVAGGNSNDGTQLQIFDCNGTASQKWNMPLN